MCLYYNYSLPEHGFKYRHIHTYYKKYTCIGVLILLTEYLLLTLSKHV